MADQQSNEEPVEMTSETQKNEEVPADENEEVPTDINEAVKAEEQQDKKSTNSQAEDNPDNAETNGKGDVDFSTQDKDIPGEIEPGIVKEEQPDSAEPSNTNDKDLPNTEPAVLASDSDAQQTSAPSNSEVDSTAQTTDQSKSEKPEEEEGQKSVPATSETVTGEKEDTKRPATEPAYVKKKKKDKKSKRRSRHSSEPPSDIPKLSRKASKVSSPTSPASLGGKRCLEAIITATFQLSDEEATGHIAESAFWEILRSTLTLESDEIAALQATILPDRAGMISYVEFASQATELFIQLYANQPTAGRHWVELQMPDGSLFINYNKKTGEAMDKLQIGGDFFTAIIEDLYTRAEKDENGSINWEMFLQVLQSAEMYPYLIQQDFEDMYAYYTSFPEEKASYNEFYSLVREAILRVYRAKDPSESPWCKVSSADVGEVWFNKYTGESFQGIPVDGSEREIEFLNQAYTQMERSNFEVEQYKELVKQLENQLAQSTEEQETLAAQIYETGHALDQANAEIIEKENEVQRLNNVILSKDQDNAELKLTLSEMDAVKMKLKETENELQRARETIANRDSSITERDTNIMALQQKAETVKDTLKNAQGRMDARDSTIARLEHQLKVEQKKLKDFEELVPELEEKLSDTTKQLTVTRKTLDEKTSALHLTRKHLKTSREKNMVIEEEMDKEMEKISQVHEKLRNMDSEIRTLKTLLTTKTAMIEKNKKDLREERQRVAELEEKDRRRAVILADVLEKTARQYQKHLGGGKSSQSGSSPSKVYVSDTHGSVEEARPFSAPAIPPEGTPAEDQTDHPSPWVVKSFTTDTQGPVIAYSSGHQVVQRVQVRAPVKERIKARSRTVPRLPPIRMRGPKQQRTKTFVFPTRQDMKKQYKIRDATLLDHCPSNPYCRCEMCTMNSTVVGQSKPYRPETGLTGMTARTAGLHGYQGETDVREVALSRQLHIGQRVVVRMKKTEFDLDPVKLTGVVRYVGKIDSEYVDHRFYVGVKLDEAVGDTDGLIKNKRYFTCPPKHGKFVRISNVVAILPNQGMKYKSLHEISKRSPYGGSIPSQKALKNPSDISVS